MVTELYINDQLVDFINTPEFAADYAIYNIEDISTRTGARSYAIKLPLTNRNKTVFESCEQVPSLSNVPYIALKARCYYNGVDLGIRFGYIESVDSVYKLRLLGENPDFFIRAAELKLIDLPFPCVFDHFWTYNNVVANRANIDGFIYAFIDYCNNSPNISINNTTTDIPAQYTYPSIFLHSVFDAMAKYFNITIDNQVEITPEYPLDKLILPFSRNKIFRNKQPARYEAFFSNNNDIVLNTAVPQIGEQPSLGVWVNMDTKTNGCGVYWDYGNFTDYFRFAEKIRFTVDYDFTFTGANAGINSDNILVFTTQLVAATNIPLQKPSNYQEINPVHIEYGVDTNVNGTFIFETEISALGNGILDDTFTVFIAGNPSQYVLRGGGYIRIRNVEILEFGEIIYNDVEQQKNYVTISSLLPDWNCAEFLKQYCLLFNALPVFANNKLSIIPFSKIREHLSNAIDWTGKVDYSEPPELLYTYNDYAQINHLKYADDKTVIKPEGTDGDLVVGNKNLEAERDLIELMYAATETVTRWFGNQAPNIKLIDGGDTNTFDSIEPRIMILEILQPSDFIGSIANFTITSQPTYSVAVVSDIPVPYFIKSNKTFNLGFGENLINNYYNVISDIIESPKILRIPIRLNASDINQLDFMRPIYLQQYESYFYISAIKGFSFSESKSTIVELVKLNI